MFRLLAFLLLQTAFTGLSYARAPAPFTAHYDISRGVLPIGTLQTTFALDAEGAYRYESRMETRGLVALLHREKVIETSRGHLRDMRFVPEHYAYSSTKGKRDYALHFDYAAGVVARTDAGGDWSAAMPDRLLDKLAYQLQIMVDMAAEPAQLDYAIADKDELKHYSIRNLGAEDVATPAAEFATVRLERAKPGSQRRTTVWCAAALGWLPVKVEYRDKDGALTTALLRRVEWH